MELRVRPVRTLASRAVGVGALPCFIWVSMYYWKNEKQFFLFPSPCGGGGDRPWEEGKRGFGLVGVNPNATDAPLLLTITWTSV